MKKRIWELDAARGFCIFCMFFVHLFFDLVSFGFIHAHKSNWIVRFFFDGWGGALFFIISGISATLGSRPVKRGLQVAGCALIVSAVTIGMDLSGFSRNMGIYFGVLHCLAVCMLVWPLFKKLERWSPKTNLIILGSIGVVLTAVGLWMRQFILPHNFLMFIGLRGPMGTSDYFPILPYLGFFLLGAVLGKTLYSKRETRFPRVSTQNIFVRFFCWLGNHSLPVYLIHQPLLFGLVYLLAILTR